MFKFIAFSVALLPIVGLTAEPTSNPARAMDLFQKTKFIWISDYTGPVESFQPDSDFLTVQIVVLGDKKQGKSGVSADGQVIFLRNGDESKSEKYISLSFEKRLKAPIAGP